LNVLDRKNGKDRNAVVGSLTEKSGVLITERPQLLDRKLIVGTLGFLQAEHVRLISLGPIVNVLDT
jgi:hypothetical protein